MMFRFLLFLAALVLSMFVILYSELTWQLIIVYGKQRIVLNLWFASLVVLLVYLTVHWVLKQLGRTLQLPSIFRHYRHQRKIQEQQYARGQAIMYALGGNYKAAIGHLSQATEQLSDLILLATWLNQLQSLQRLDEVLSKIQSMNKIPDGWMVWFRAYLLFERGRRKLASDLLLDAIESGVYSRQIVQALVTYAEPEVHYQSLLQHYALLSRYADTSVLHSKLLEGASYHCNTLLSEKDWYGMETALSLMPKKVRQAPSMQYYRVKMLLHQQRIDKLLTVLQSISFEDDRLIAFLAQLEVPMDKKINIVGAAVDREPENKNLLYLLSYLHAQSGSVDDTVKMLESAISKVY